MRRKLTRREESAHDRACGCNPQGDAEGPDHPFPVLRNAAIPNVPEPQPQEDQEQDGKQGRGGGFVYTANRHRVAHHEGRHADDDAKKNQEPAGPAVPTDMARSNAAYELKRQKGQEQTRRKNVRQRERFVPRESRIDLCGCRKAGWPLWRVEEHVRSARGRQQADRDEEKSKAPNQPSTRASVSSVIQTPMTRDAQTL